MISRTLLSIALTITLSACGDKTEDSGNDGQTDDCISEGLEGSSLYASNCAGCHGADGGGVSGPSLADSMVVRSDDFVLEIIRDGSGGMPGFDGTLTCGEQTAILEYLRDQHGDEGGA